MFLKWQNNSGKLQIIGGKFQNSEKFQNNGINDVKQISLSHVIRSEFWRRFCVMKEITECWYSSCSVPRNGFFLSSVSKKIARESVDSLRFLRLYCIVYSQLVFVNIHKPLRFFFPGSWFIISEPDKIEDLRNLFTKKIFKRI